MRTIRKQLVEETDIGVYVWQMPDGRIVADEDGNYLNIAARKGDLRRIKTLTEAARYYGIEEGAPLFLAGHRQVTDEEFEEQKQRMLFGLVPDDHDVPALKDELRARRSS